MPDEAALIDAPEEVEAPAIDTGASGAQEIDAGGTESTGEQEEGDSGESLRGSALWRETKKLAQEGKPLTPKLLSQLNKAIHRADAIETKYPEGLSALEGTMQAVKQLADDESMPMAEVIQQAVQERSYFRELDQLFTHGKPEFVDKMSEASPEAFQNIAPAVFRKYAEMNPDGYSQYVSQAVVNHMNSAGVPMQFQVLEAFWPQVPNFPGKEQFQKAMASVIDWTDALKGMASKKIEAKVVPNGQAASNGTDLATENANLKIENARVLWNASVRSEGVNLVMSEAQKAAGKVPLSEKERQTVLAKVGEEMDARLTADRRYGEAMQGYLRAGNRSAYLQRIQSERKKLIPAAVRRAVADVVEARPKNATKPPAPAGAPVKKPASELNGAVQFRRIAGPPRTLGMKVDLSKTTHSMLEKRQAILVGGERVQWGPMARA